MNKAVFCFIIIFLVQNIYAISNYKSLPVKIKNIGEIITCFDCCYPIDNDFCEMVYYSCHTFALNEVIWFF